MELNQPLAQFTNANFGLAASDQAVDPAHRPNERLGFATSPSAPISRHLGPSPRVRGTHWRWWARHRQRRRLRVLAAAVTAVFRRDTTRVRTARTVGNPAWVRWGQRGLCVWVGGARTLCWRPNHIELQCRVDQAVHRRRDAMPAAKFDHLASEPWQFEAIAAQQIVAH